MMCSVQAMLGTEGEETDLLIAEHAVPLPILLPAKVVQRALAHVALEVLRVYSLHVRVPRGTR